MQVKFRGSFRPCTRVSDGTCKYCGLAIVWATLDNGQFIPLEPEEKGMPGLMETHYSYCYPIGGRKRRTPNPFGGQKQPTQPPQLLLVRASGCRQPSGASCCGSSIRTNITAARMNGWPTT